MNPYESPQCEPEPLERAPPLSIVSACAFVMFLIIPAVLWFGPLVIPLLAAIGYREGALQRDLPLQIALYVAWLVSCLYTPFTWLLLIRGFDVIF